ncbi:hypothetical protein LPJ59_002322 [Coemansia sp. RSA 2399]|nr:hypothetical protein LPJ59_002322 [Coemansia sp. RSA 2399]
MVKGVKTLANAGVGTNLSSQLKVAMPYIKWAPALFLKNKVFIDFGLEFYSSPAGTSGGQPVVPTTLVWRLEKIAAFVKQHGAIKISRDNFCHTAELGGVRFGVGRGNFCDNKVVYGQMYMTEKSLVYNYAAAHGMSKFGAKDVWKYTNKFNSQLTLMYEAASTGSRRSFSARIEFRMQVDSAAAFQANLEYMDGLTRNLGQDCLVQLNSADLFKFKRLRIEAIAHVAWKLRGNIRHKTPEVGQNRLAHWLRILCLGTVSRPDDDSGARQLARMLKVKEAMVKYGLPIPYGLDLNTVTLWAITDDLHNRLQADRDVETAEDKLAKRIANRARRAAQPSSHFVCETVQVDAPAVSAVRERDELLLDKDAPVNKLAEQIIARLKVELARTFTAPGRWLAQGFMTDNLGTMDWTVEQWRLALRPGVPFIPVSTLRVSWPERFEYYFGDIPANSARSGAWKKIKIQQLYPIFKTLLTDAKKLALDAALMVKWMELPMVPASIPTGKLWVVNAKGLKMAINPELAGR